jgi:cholesterol oxidase
MMNRSNDRHDYDYVVVGSGFGGSVSALRLAEKGYRVAIIEMGRRWTPDNMPTTTWQLWRWLWRPQLGMRGFFSMRFFRHVLVLHGNAVGGGSIVYGNTLMVPPDAVWSQGTWAGLNDWLRVMPAHYATAKRVLGVTQNRLLGPADLRLKEMAEQIGLGRSFYKTDVAVFFGDEGKPAGIAYADPFFGGAGPDRNSCIGCGGCMVGCRYNAKNSLDKNYLYLAERNGAQLFAQTKVTDVRPLCDKDDGSLGYEVNMMSSVGRREDGPKRLTCRGIVFAASSLGTQELLLRLKDLGALPHLSDALGKRVRTNAESIIGMRYPATMVDLSQGLAIGSGVYIDRNTDIQVCRYPRGSDAIALISTVQTFGRADRTRSILWLATLLKLLVSRPRTTLRALWPGGFAAETMLLLCMQTIDAHIDMRLKRPWFWPFVKVLASEGKPLPAFISEANAFARKMAQVSGGFALTSITEILFSIPTTAHCMGGAGMARTPEDGVCDGKNRVFGYANMYICDGSVLGANLGVNPSLTIAALTEHAMSHVPTAAEQKWMTAAA